MANLAGIFGSTAGGTIGAAIGGPFAPITGAIGSVLGSLFGGGQHGPKKSEIDIATSANNIAEFQSNFQAIGASIQSSTTQYTTAVEQVASDTNAATLISMLGAGVVLIALLARK